MNFLPGEPNSAPQALCLARWAHHSVLTYCSGNNLIILTRLLAGLQTICFDQDLSCIDINSATGLLAVGCGRTVYFYRPVSVGKGGQLRWEYAVEVEVDLSTIHSLSWSSQGELVVGTAQRLALYRIDRADELSDYLALALWQQPLSSPCYLVRFSQNSELIACVFKYDKFVKFFYRINFDTANTQFNLLYLRHSAYVTDLRFRFIDHSADATKTAQPGGDSNQRGSSNYNVLYTVSSDSYIRVFLSFEFQRAKKIQHWGSLKLADSSIADAISGTTSDISKTPKFIKIIDNYFFDYMISRALQRFRKNVSSDQQALEHNLKKLIQLESDLIMVAEPSGNLSFYLVTNLNLNPPKAILFKKLSFASNEFTSPPTPSTGSSIQSHISIANNGTAIKFPDGVFPSNPQYIQFSDSIKIHRSHHGIKSSANKKITFANYQDLNSTDEFSNKGDLAFVIHDLVKKTFRFVYLRLDDFLRNINYDELYHNYEELFTQNLNQSITNLSLKNPNALSSVDNATSVRNFAPESTFEEKLRAPTQHKRFQYLNAVLGDKITGHNKSVQRLFKDLSGEAVLSISRFSEHKIWAPLKLSEEKRSDITNRSTTLQRKASLFTESNIINAILLRSGDIIITYSADHKLEIWDTRENKIARKLYDLEALTGQDEKSELLAFFHLPEYHHDYKYDLHYVIGIYKSEQDGRVAFTTKAWQVNLKNLTLTVCDIGDLTQTVRHATKGIEESDNDISCISPVDPVGWNISLDNYSRDILVLITKSGMLKSFSVKIEKFGSGKDTKIKWINNSTILTNITNASYIKGSLINKIVIVDETKTKFYIYNTTYPLLEYSQDFSKITVTNKSAQEDNKIQDVDWANITSETFSNTNTRNTPCVLSIGFKHSVLLFTQLNFDYTNNLPSFAPIKKINLSTYTSHLINDSIWLNNGLLVIGIGNQLFISDNYSSGSLTTQMISEDNYTKKIIGDRSLNNNSIDSIFNLVEILNNTLPVYHPQFIIQCIYFGKVSLVKKIFLKLYLYLKRVDIDDISSSSDEDSAESQLDGENDIYSYKGKTSDGRKVKTAKKFKVKNLPRLLGLSIEEFYMKHGFHERERKPKKVEVASDTSSLFLASDTGSSYKSEPLTITEDQLYTTKNFDTWVNQLKNKLMEISLPVLTRHQQITLLTIIESLEIIEKYKLLTNTSYNAILKLRSLLKTGSSAKDNEEDEDEDSSLDMNGVNFLVGYKLYQSHFKTQPCLNMRDNIFGIHCRNKEVLLDIINGNITADKDSASHTGPSSSSQSKMTWDRCKRTGMVYWLSDTLLLKQFEVIANNEFQNSVTDSDALGYSRTVMKRLSGNFSLRDGRDESIPYFETSKSRSPINSTLFYLALQKKPILIKLWQISHGHPEQAKMIKFLSMDFKNSEKNRTSAIKNAFALLSKRRFYLASCFFLLGGSLSDCVNVLIKKCNDLELAIGVARVHEYLNDASSSPIIKNSRFAGLGGSLPGSGVFNSQMGSNSALNFNFKGPVLTQVLINHVLPIVLADGDRWLNTYVYWSLGEDKLALLAMLKSPLEVLRDNICGEGTVEKHGQKTTFLKDSSLLTEFQKVLDAFEKERALAVNKVTDGIASGRFALNGSTSKNSSFSNFQSSMILKEKEIVVSDNSIFLKTDPILIVIYKEMRNEIFYSTPTQTSQQQQLTKSVLGIFQNKNGFANDASTPQVNSGTDGDKAAKASNGAIKSQLLKFNDYEFEYVYKVSLIYSRMGCDYLSIDILKNWNFAQCKFAQTFTLPDEEEIRPVKRTLPSEITQSTETENEETNEKNDKVDSNEKEEVKSGESKEKGESSFGAFGFEKKKPVSEVQEFSFDAFDF